MGIPIADSHVARRAFGLGAVVAAAIALAMARGQIPAVRDDFAQIAEGRTSTKAGATITAGYRMFSAPEVDTVCQRARAHDVVRLRTSAETIRLRVGRPFEPRRLTIDALDARGALVPGVPIAIEIDADSKRVDASIADGVIRPVAIGDLRIRIRTICAGPVVELFMTARIT